MDIIDLAIYARLNDLADRHGLKPYDFVAVFRHDESAGIGQYKLDFELPASGNALREARFDTMLNDLGIVQGYDAVLRGDCESIIDALEAAMAVAPRPRGRF